MKSYKQFNEGVVIPFRKKCTHCDKGKVKMDLSDLPDGIDPKNAYAYCNHCLGTGREVSADERKKFMSEGVIMEEKKIKLVFFHKGDDRHKPGWYHWDEDTVGMHGPYKSEKQATKRLNTYTRDVLGIK